MISVLYWLVCGVILAAGGMLTAGVFMAAGAHGVAGYVVAVLFLAVWCGLAYGAYQLYRKVIRGASAAAGAKWAAREPRPRKEKAPRKPLTGWVVLRYVVVVIGILVGLALAIIYNSVIFGVFLIAMSLCALKFDNSEERWHTWKERRAEDEAAKPKPVKAVLVTAAQGQQNRLADAAAGNYLFGGAGALYGMFRGRPKGRAVFYVTWSDGHTSTEEAVLGTERFLRFMALTERKE